MSVPGDVAAAECRVSALAGIGGPASTFLAGARPPVRAAADPARFDAGVADAVRSLVRDAARAAHVDPALALAVAGAESHFDPAARSRAGAAGVMQLMPGTAQALGVENPYDPAQNVRGGTRYLRELLDRFGGDVPRAVAAYDAGPRAVDAYGGVPPYAETQRYVARVMAAYRGRPDR